MGDFASTTMVLRVRQLPFYLLLALALVPPVLSAGTTWDYCIVGAGPAGLQMGALLQHKQRDYVIFERNSAPGSFFDLYPRHRQLNSINKQHIPGLQGNDSEIGLRFDQHSLFASPGRILPMSEFSQDFYPKADDYVKYLKNFASTLGLNIQYDSDVQISRVPGSPTHYIAKAQETQQACQVVFIATGLHAPRQPPAQQGSEHFETYATMSIDPQDYLNQSVLILGNGNSAFETAQALEDTAAQVWVVGKRRVRLASESFYEGDIQASVNKLVDSYHLKSLDAIGEHNFDPPPSVVPDGEDGAGPFFKLMNPSYVMKFKALQRYRKKLQNKGEYKQGTEGKAAEEFIKTHPEIGRKYLELRAGFDDNDGHGWSTDLWRSHKLILSYGFEFNETVFKVCQEKRLPGDSDSEGAECNKETDIDLDYLEGKHPEQRQMSMDGGNLRGTRMDGYMTSRENDIDHLQYPVRTYPVTGTYFQSMRNRNMYFLGALMHGEDHRVASGGFIHGFRHLVVALHHHLEQTRHNTEWPSQTVGASPEALTEALVARASNSAAVVSMQGQLVDLLLLPTQNTTGTLFTGVPGSLVWTLVPDGTAYALLTFARARVGNTAEVKELIKREVTESQRQKGATQAMNSRLGEMDEKKIQIPLEMEREADMMNYKSGIQEHIANMFLDHDPFHAGRHALKPEDAAQGHTLHPVVHFVCDHQGEPEVFHMLESTDHDYSSLTGHVIPMLNQIKKVMSECTKTRK